MNKYNHFKDDQTLMHNMLQQNPPNPLQPIKNLLLSHSLQRYST